MNDRGFFLLSNIKIGLIFKNLYEWTSIIILSSVKSEYLDLSVKCQNGRFAVMFRFYQVNVKIHSFLFAFQRSRSQNYEEIRTPTMPVMKALLKESFPPVVFDSFPFEEDKNVESSSFSFPF